MLLDGSRFIVSSFYSFIAALSSIFDQALVVTKSADLPDLQDRSNIEDYEHPALLVWKPWGDIVTNKETQKRGVGTVFPLFEALPTPHAHTSLTSIGIGLLQRDARRRDQFRTSHTLSARSPRKHFDFTPLVVAVCGQHDIIERCFLPTKVAETGSHPRSQSWAVGFPADKPSILITELSPCTADTGIGLLSSTIPEVPEALSDLQWWLTFLPHCACACPPADFRPESFCSLCRPKNGPVLSLPVFPEIEEVMKQAYFLACKGFPEASGRPKKGPKISWELACGLCAGTNGSACHLWHACYRFAITGLIQTKTVSQCVEYYYSWKKILKFDCNRAQVGEKRPRTEHDEAELDEEKGPAGGDFPDLIPSFPFVKLGLVFREPFSSRVCALGYETPPTEQPKAHTLLERSSRNSEDKISGPRV
ncbi:Zinc finger protein, partial [Ophiophagus hannah]